MSFPDYRSPISGRWLLLIIVLALVLTATRAARIAQAQTEVEELPGSETLIVGLYDEPPFAIRVENGWDGLAVQLWREAAGELNWSYELVEIEREGALDAVSDGRIDVLLSATATPEGEAQVDFTHSYLTSSLAIARGPEDSILEIAGAIASQRVLRLAGWLVLALLGAGFLLWIFERRANPEQFGGGVLRGLWDAFWWAGVTVSTIGYGDRTPESVGGRIVALLWMLVAMGVTAVLTATVTSALALDTGLFTPQFNNLRSMEVGSIDASAIATYLEEEGVSFAPYESAVDGLQAVDENELEAFVFDSAVLAYLNNEQLNNQLNVTATGRVPQYHVFAVSSGSELLEPLNRQLLARTTTTGWRNVLERYLPAVLTNSG